MRINKYSQLNAIGSRSNTIIVLATKTLKMVLAVALIAVLATKLNEVGTSAMQQIAQ